MTVDQWFVLAGLFVAALVGGVPIVQSRRRDERERDEKSKDETAQAIKDALAPVYRELDQLREQRGPRERRGQ